MPSAWEPLGSHPGTARPGSPREPRNEGSESKGPGKSFRGKKSNLRLCASHGSTHHRCVRAWGRGGGTGGNEGERRARKIHVEQHGKRYSRGSRRPFRGGLGQQGGPIRGAPYCKARSYPRLGASGQPQVLGSVHRSGSSGPCLTPVRDPPGDSGDVGGRPRAMHFEDAVGGIEREGPRNPRARRGRGRGEGRPVTPRPYLEYLLPVEGTSPALACPSSSDPGGRRIAPVVPAPLLAVGGVASSPLAVPSRQRG